MRDTKRYDAFGMLVASSGSNPTPFGFVGGAQYQSDADSGLMLLGHRYYDASIGRFISRDPIQAGTNWYAYCENKPINHLDKTGLWQLQFGVSAVIVDCISVAGADTEWIIDFPGWDPRKWSIGVGVHVISPDRALGFGLLASASFFVGLAPGPLATGTDNSGVVGGGLGWDGGATGTLITGAQGTKDEGNITGGSFSGGKWSVGPTFGAGVYGGSVVGSTVKIASVQDVIDPYENKDGPNPGLPWIY